MKGKKQDSEMVVLMTASSEEEADRIARGLLKKRLIACANLVPGIRSLYRWKGRLCDDPEILLLCKTRRALFPSLEKEAKRLHSYEVPEMIGLSVEEGSAPYLAWLRTETKRHPARGRDRKNERSLHRHNDRVP